MPATAAPCQTTVLDLALDHVPVMAGRIDAQHRLCFANPPLTTALGSSLDKLLGSREKRGQVQFNALPRLLRVDIKRACRHLTYRCRHSGLLDRASTSVPRQRMACVSDKF